jgi:hypothetical protein
MGIFVAEIGGRGIAAYGDVSRAEAEEWFESAPFKAGLTVLEDNAGKPLWDGVAGKPLWDGVAEILIRSAFPEEAEQWEASRHAALIDHDLDSEDDEWVLFLVPVVDPADDA